MKTTFTSERGRVRHEVELPAADSAVRSGPRAWFIAASIVAHAALFVALRAPAPSRALTRAHDDDLVTFELPALTPPPVAAVEPPPAPEPPPPPERAVRVLAPRATSLEAVAANPPPAPEPAPAAAPSEPAPAEPTAGPGALPTDGQGAIAMATGPGGAGGALGGGGTGTGGGTRIGAQGPGGNGVGGTGVDRRALALAWKAAVERLLRERASLNYPRSARRAHLGGTVLLSITVDARGHITLVRVDRTSGVEVLDEAAVATVNDVGAVPPPPAELAWQTRALRMPIEYAVR